jgi:hypothetical protein
METATDCGKVRSVRELMKSHMKWICLVCAAALFSAVNLQAQPGAGPGRGMTAGPPGPGLSGSTARLFGQNTSFSAQLEMQTAAGQGTDAMSIPGKLFFDQGNSRFEMDMSEIKGGMMSPQAAAAMKSVGIDKTIVVSRPDKNAAYQIYPGVQAYIETKLPQKEASAPASDFKLELTELAKETIDGRPCVKNRAVVTDKDGIKHEAVTWNASELKDFPVKIEQNEGGTTTTMLFKDVRFTKPAPELFLPPANMTKYDNLQSMMQSVLMKQLGGGAPHPSDSK